MYSKIETMKKVKLNYRDGANYKFSHIFDVPEDNLKPYSVGDEVSYLSLGITQEEFLDALGLDFDLDIDHTFVTIIEIY